MNYRFISNGFNSARLVVKAVTVIIITVVIGYITALEPILSLLIVFGFIFIFACVFIWFNPKLALSIVMIALPFHSLAMRVIEVHTGASPSLILLVSSWKEALLLMLLIRPVGKNWVKLTLLDLVLIAYLLINTAYLLFSDSASIGLYGYRGVILPFVFYVLARKYSFSSDEIRRLLKFLAIAILIVAIFAFVQAIILGSSFLLKYRVDSLGVLSNSHRARIGDQLIIRASSTFTSPNHLGMYISIFILISLGVFIADNRGLTKAIIPTLIILLALVLTFSRSSWLALVAGFFAMIVFRGKIMKRLLLVLLILGILILPILFQFDVYGRIKETVTFEDPSAAGKLPSILNGIRFVIDNPVGIGLGMAGPRSVRFTDSIAFHSENYYVLMAMEIGIIGLFSYLVILVSALYQLYRASIRVSDPLFRGVILGTGLAMLGASVGVIFIPSLQEIVVASLLWFFVGVSIQAAESERSQYMLRQVN